MNIRVPIIIFGLLCATGPALAQTPPRCVADKVRAQLNEIDLKSVTRIDQIEDRLWAVYATNRIPADGTIRTGSRTSFLSPTVHFSLGQLVPPHANGNWESKAGAVIVPFKEVAPQAANFMALDLFTIGDFKIPKSAVWVVPKGTAKETGGISLFEYDPQKMNLRKAVQAAIEEKNGLALSTRSDFGGDSSDYVSFKKLFEKASDPSDVDAPNLNSVEFFRPVLDRYPGRSFGTHGNSIIGDAERLGQIMFTLQAASNQSLGSPPVQAMSFAAIRTHLPRLDESVAKMSLPPEALSSYRSYTQEVDKVVSPMEKSLVAKAADSVDPLSLFSDDYVRAALASLRSNDLDSFVKELEKLRPGLPTKMGGPAFFQLAWISERFRELRKAGATGYAQAKVEGLVELAQAAETSADKAISLLPAGSQKSSFEGLRKVLTQDFVILYKKVK